jgi:hypothetical protein
MVNICTAVLCQATQQVAMLELVEQSKAMLCLATQQDMWGVWQLSSALAHSLTAKLLFSRTSNAMFGYTVQLSLGTFSNGLKGGVLICTVKNASSSNIHGSSFWWPSPANYL